MQRMRNYKHAIKQLNSLQTNYNTIQEIQSQWSQGKPSRDPNLIPEMLEWIRRIGYTAEDLDVLKPIHVTGTKGKGSVCAFVQSILLQYVDTNRNKLGLFTSPHLKSVRERIMINGEPISEDKFAKYFFEVYDRLDTTESDTSLFPRLAPSAKPMYFRFLTLVSFHAFVQEKVDHAIYEVGIGGEYDATNVFRHPSACGITSLGLDHTSILGNTIEEIAWNKSGIFKPGAPAFTLADQPIEALEVMKKRASELDVSKFEIVPVHPDIRNKKLGLKGSFQEKNATLACYLASERLGIPISNDRPLPKKFLKGLEEARWPGRCQIIETPKAKWFIDGAHTMESLEIAAKWLADEVGPDQTISLVFNQQKRDNVEDLLRSLYESLKSYGIKVSNAYFTTNQSFDAGFPDEMISHNVCSEAVDKLTVQNRLAEVWSSLDPDTRVLVVPSLEQAVKKAEGKVFATGSLLMVGGLLAVID